MIKTHANQPAQAQEFADNRRWIDFSIGIDLGPNHITNRWIECGYDLWVKGDCCGMTGNSDPPGSHFFPKDVPSRTAMAIGIKEGLQQFDHCLELHLGHTPFH